MARRKSIVKSTTPPIGPGTGAPPSKDRPASLTPGGTGKITEAQIEQQAQSQLPSGQVVFVQEVTDQGIKETQVAVPFGKGDEAPEAARKFEEQVITSLRRGEDVQIGEGGPTVRTPVRETPTVAPITRAQARERAIAGLSPGVRERFEQPTRVSALAAAGFGLTPGEQIQRAREKGKRTTTSEVQIGTGGVFGLPEPRRTFGERIIREAERPAPKDPFTFGFLGVEKEVPFISNIVSRLRRAPSPRGAGVSLSEEGEILGERGITPGQQSFLTSIFPGSSALIEAGRGRKKIEAGQKEFETAPLTRAPLSQQLRANLRVGFIGTEPLIDLPRETKRQLAGEAFLRGQELAIDIGLIEAGSRIAGGTRGTRGARDSPLTTSFERDIPNLRVIEQGGKDRGLGEITGFVAREGEVTNIGVVGRGTTLVEGPEGTVVLESTFGAAGTRVGTGPTRGRVDILTSELLPSRTTAIPSRTNLGFISETSAPGTETLLRAGGRTRTPSISETGTLDFITTPRVTRVGTRQTSRLTSEVPSLTQEGLIIRETTTPTTRTSFDVVARTEGVPRLTFGRTTVRTTPVEPPFRIEGRSQPEIFRIEGRGATARARPSQIDFITPSTGRVPQPSRRRPSPDEQFLADFSSALGTARERRATRRIQKIIQQRDTERLTSLTQISDQFARERQTRDIFSQLPRATPPTTTRRAVTGRESVEILGLVAESVETQARQQQLQSFVGFETRVARTQTPALFSFGRQRNIITDSRRQTGRGVFGIEERQPSRTRTRERSVLTPRRPTTIPQNIFDTGVRTEAGRRRAIPGITATVSPPLTTTRQRQRTRPFIEAPPTPVQTPFFQQPPFPSLGFIPPFASGGFGRRGRRRGQLRRPRSRFTPSVVALEFGIFGREPKGVTGVGVRVVPTRRGKKPKIPSIRNVIGI